MKPKTLHQLSFPFMNFDSYPDSAQIRLPILKELLGVSNATIWRMVKAGKIKTYKLTERTTTFNVGEVRLFLKQVNSSDK